MVDSVVLQVNFNEPLSLLQRMSEDLVYSQLLTRAAQCSNTLEEIAYVAAYVNSAYASTSTRIGKPFNPMLYETFENDRRADPNCGWRLITEQVCAGVFELLARRPASLFPSSGQPSPSHVCYACGAQGLDLLAGVHCSIKVPWPVLGVLSTWHLSFGDACQQELLQLDQSHHHHTQYHCRETVD